MEELSILLAGLIAAIILAALLVHLAGRQRELRTVLDRVDARLDEQGKRGDALSLQLGERTRMTEDIVRKLDQDLREQQAAAQRALLQQLADAREHQQKAIHELRESSLQRFGELRQGLEQRHAEALRSLQASVDRVQEQVSGALHRYAEELGKRMGTLTEATDRKLLEISGQVERRLAEGFEKTTATFTEIQNRLLLIDEAQKQITELSGNVVSLQEVLADRSSRGIFGEVQLSSLVRNVLPEKSYRMQHSLSNGKMVDCILFLPPPTGNVPIDSKFPLENYRRKTNPDLSAEERKAAERNFAKDVRLHLEDIASKYILPGETADGAVMFIPAEAVFAEIHASHPDLVEEAHRRRVWMTSPTTLMAVLTTARAVLKDAATRQQVDIIQEQLRRLSKDFARFQSRMDNLAARIRQAHEEADRVHISARKISGRFEKIEQLDLSDGEPPDLLEGEVEEAEGPEADYAGDADLRGN